MTRKEGLVPKISNGSFRYLMENDGYYVDKTSVILQKKLSRFS